MGKKITGIVFITLFLLICLAPFVMMGKNKDTGSAENRELSSFPSIRGNGEWNEEFFSQFDTYVAEHMGLRSELIDWNSRLMAGIFGISSEDGVILGKEDWLYYAETAADYMKVATLSDRSLNNIASSLGMMQTYCEEQGSAFVFTIAPNKNTLYGEQMPGNYLPLDSQGNREKLEERLQQMGVNYANLTREFQDTDEVLYQKRDSHWNYKGALLAYNCILDKTGFEHLRFDDVTFTETKDWDADLLNMLTPDAPDEDSQLRCDYAFTYEFTSHETKVEALTLQTAQPNGTGKLVMYRDSFCNTMQCYFSESFQEATFSRAVPYKLTTVKREKPEVTIVEIVERNLCNLAEKAPVMEAPKAKIDNQALDFSNAENEVFYEYKYALTHLYGSIDESYLGEAYQVYLLCEDEDGTSVYEAFPIYESELLGEEDVKDNGFSIYLPYKEDAQFRVSLVVETKGNNYIDSSFTWK